VTLTGTVDSVRFHNPHVFFSLVTANGTWTVEAEGLPVLRRAGIDDTVLKSGAKAIVTGWKAKSGTAELGLKSISVGGKSATLRRSTR
jgi:hypothetical protein